MLNQRSPPRTSTSVFQNVRRNGLELGINSFLLINEKFIISFRKICIVQFQCTTKQWCSPFPNGKQACGGEDTGEKREFHLRGSRAGPSSVTRVLGGQSSWPPAPGLSLRAGSGDSGQRRVSLGGAPFCLGNSLL